MTCSRSYRGLNYSVELTSGAQAPASLLLTGTAPAWLYAVCLRRVVLKFVLEKQAPAQVTVTAVGTLASGTATSGASVTAAVRLAACDGTLIPLAAPGLTYTASHVHPTFTTPCNASCDGSGTESSAPLTAGLRIGGSRDARLAGARIRELNCSAPGEAPVLARVGRSARVGANMTAVWQAGVDGNNAAMRCSYINATSGLTQTIRFSVARTVDGCSEWTTDTVHGASYVAAGTYHVVPFPGGPAGLMQRHCLHELFVLLPAGSTTFPVCPQVACCRHELQRLIRSAWRR